MSAPPEILNSSDSEASVLHFCKREILRPLRDQILRLSGYHVDSTDNPEELLDMFRNRPYKLALIDVDGEAAVREAESMCAEIRTERPHQLVAFVCNWRVAILNNCPDEIVRTEFNPEAFLSGVREVLAAH